MPSALMSDHLNTQKPKPLDIFIVAEQFRFAGKLATLVPHHPSLKISQLAFAHDQNLPTATMVCAAFSLELYFKCLIRMEKKPYQMGHDLKKLFDVLGRHNKIKIKKYRDANSSIVISDVQDEFIANSSPIPKVDFGYCLSVSKDAFNLMRYIYERGIPPGAGWLGDVIVEGARQTILDRHPEWERKRQIEPQPRTSFRSTYQSH
jgi:hypothetical protein